MHLSEMLAVRSIPASGLFLSLTRRCPLSCSHCSTQSTTNSEEQEEEPLIRFVKSFTRANRPEFLLLTGGEPLMRPTLVSTITSIAHSVGCKVSLSSGMYFAINQKIPPPIFRAISEVDHLIVSLDKYHEQEVPRNSVFRVILELLANGKDISFHIVGNGADDPYITEVVEQVRTTFQDRIPVIVAEVQPIGRAADWLASRQFIGMIDEPEPKPCSFAAWPVVTFNGSVVACCNQRVIDGQAPKHLQLGHVATDTWEEIRNRYQSSGVYKALRIFGPQFLRHRFTSTNGKCDGYCESCWKLSDDQEVIDSIEQFGSRSTMTILEKQIGYMLGDMPLQGSIHKYAHLTTLGATSKAKGPNS